MEHVKVSQEGHILVIHVDRAEKYNALSPEIYHAIGKALKRLNDDPELRVAVLHAAGKHFTAGVELDKWAPIFGSGSAFPVRADEVDPMGLTGERHKRPPIIAGKGDCFTWGVLLLPSTQVRNAVEDTPTHMSEVQLG